MTSGFSKHARPTPNYTESRGYSPLTATSDIDAGTEIIGAGIIGLSLALELRLRGHSITVVERGTPLAQASTAAAGMLAAEDPHNPPGLLSLARLSASLYAAFLARVGALSGFEVPFQTENTFQGMPDGSTQRLAERSIDPRQLARALLQSAKNIGVRFRAICDSDSHEQSFLMLNREQIRVYTTGAWGGDGVPVSPRKGQMLRVHMPADLAFRDVYRNEQVYVVPRTQGPQAGTALIGATVEDAGFDTSTSPRALAKLRALGAELVPAVRDEAHAPMVEAWAGLRPATEDLLPILGELQQAGKAFDTARRFVATGHFRNGILLAPATAAVMADLIEGRPPAVDLQAFSPSRFSAAAVLPLSIGRR